MTDETVVISPELGGGGLGDYTRRLLEEWPQIPSLRLVVPKSAEAPLDSFAQYPVAQIERSSQALLSRLPPRRGKVLVQYSAYGFDRFGYPRWLLKGLVDWQKKSGGFLAIMFHEIWTFWPVWNKNYFFQRLHRRDLRELLGVAGAVFTSTSSQAEHLRVLAPECAVEVLPAGSNIRRTSPATIERKPGLGVLFGSQPARLQTLRRLSPDLKLLSGAGKIRKVVTAGGSNSPAGDKEEAGLLTKLGLPDGFERRGLLPESEISVLLSEGAFGISGQDQLSITKSSALMAYAAHGLNILSPYAGASKAEPICLLTSPEELMQGALDAEARSEKLRQWQERTSSWPHIARQVAKALQLEGAAS